MLWKMFKLYAPEGDGGAGGAGDAKPLTADDVGKLIDERLGKAVNAAVTAQLKRVDFAKMIGDAVAQAIPPKDGDDPPAGGDDKGGKAGGGKLDPELERRIKAAEKAADDARKLAADEKAKREEAEAKARAQEERTQLHGLLQTAKIRPELLELTVDQLHAKRLVRDDEGALRWKGDDGALVDPKDGLAAFLKTPTGLALLPPRDAGGSGAGGGKPPAGGGKPGDLSDAQFVAGVLGNGTPGT